MTIHEEFDLAKLRLNPADVDGQTVKTVISIPVHKPPRHDWIRVHPEESIDVGGIQLKDGDDEFYLVSPDVLEAVAGEVSYYSLFPYINRLGCYGYGRCGCQTPTAKLTSGTARPV
jgi:hypothetical protein